MAEKRACLQPSTNLTLCVGLGLVMLARGAMADAIGQGTTGNGHKDSTAEDLGTAQGSDSGGAPNASDGAGWTSNFSLLEEYRLRIASHQLQSSGPLGEPVRQQSDQHLRLQGDGQISGLDDHFRAMASGALWLDLDGRSPPGAPNVFATSYDNAQPWVVFYAAFVEW